jgi:16S rRNA (uracil1498-N3)-methyltransferase
VQRFFVPAEWLQRDPVVLTGETAHQITRVLRMRPGDECLLLDDSGWAYRLVLEGLGPDRVTGRVVERLQPDTEPTVLLWLHQALLPERKMDWVLQKGTELGVAVFAPIATERSVHGRKDAVDEAKLGRWRRIVREAAEQSGRARLPELRPPEPLAAACARAAREDTLDLMAAVDPGALPLRLALSALNARSFRQIHLFIGPEGGFSPAEAERARRAGIVPVSLGPRVLRTETAGMVALAAILYARGELG